MYHVSAQGVDERMINVHNYCYYRSTDRDVRRSIDRDVGRSTDHDNGSPRMRVDSSQSRYYKKNLRFIIRLILN